MFGPYKESDFPMTVMVQNGEIFGGKIEWYGKPVKETLEVIEGEPSDFSYPGEKGEKIVASMFGDYAGWDDEYKVFTRYPGGVSQNEHCIRIVPEKKELSLKEQKKALREKMKKLKAEYEAAQKELKEIKEKLKEE